MFRTILLAASACLLAGSVHAQQPANTFQPSNCDASIQGNQIALRPSCLRTAPTLRNALADLSVYLHTTNPDKLVSPGYAGPLEVEKLQQTVEQLLQKMDNASAGDVQFHFYALGDPDDKRPVQFGGYFTPVLEVSAKPTGAFQYPIYAKPADGTTRLPTRGEIMQGALRGKGLEIAWTNNPVDYYFMQVQGSGLIRYQDGRTQLLGFAGKNGYPYTSIGRYMQQQGYLRTGNLSNTAIRQWFKLNPGKADEVLAANQSFVFFQPTDEAVRSASGLPVVAGHTASVDPSIIPFGSILLAELPLRDNNGKIVQHEWRLLLATDRRADDKTAVRIGIYTGEGEAAKAAAARFFPAGRAFILQSGA
ncbi:MltA domain-containing protein [Thiothrix nivea]|uniref:MltA domain protein n=1 Tax=Thiothrix nivea (strain ATCC 35100 / DSM 5205 / JP2) TaxID=870187 RepID=A0A656HEZ2_THINJ|nr:MltA domain-containing protein [Thiothrix nivea]EIJ35651.1 MltA domain protein [Thiothrix nivea DSM 5205]